MFTGLIEEIGTVKTVRNADNGIYITISSKKIMDDIKTGDSISIDGACQTVTEFTNDAFTVFASKITCEISTLGGFKAGRKVNLERAMSAGSRFGGHFVQGHVDGKAKIKSILKKENGMTIEIAVPPGIMRYIAAKGSVAVDGISLTVVELTENGFVLYIIPETIKNTTLPLKKNEEVNIEVDIIAKYVERMISNKKDELETNSNEKLEKDVNFKRLLFEKGYI